MGNITNEELVQKAVITTDAIVSAGKLNPVQADRFIDYVFDLTGLKNNARTVRFNAEQMHIDKIGVGKRAALPAVEAVAPAVRRGVTTSRIAITPQEIILPFEIGDTFTEINLEGKSVEEHIIQMMAKQLANDLETLYIEGDTLGRAITEEEYMGAGSTTQYMKDAYLAMFNGWLRRADSGNVLDAAGATVGSSLFSRMISAMPIKFRRNRQDLRFITSLDLDQAYRERVSSRVGAVGDAALQGTGNLSPFGIPLAPFNLYPFKYREVEHVTLPGTTAVALRRKPVANEVVLPLVNNLPTTPYVRDTDYAMDYANGTIARIGGAISDGATVKITYEANPTVILTHFQNLIVAIGRDIRIEKDRDIYRRTSQYAITCKVAVELEEPTALVKAVNIGV